MKHNPQLIKDLNTVRDLLKNDNVSRAYLKGTATKIYIPLSSESEAVLVLAIATEGLGALDPQTLHEPTAAELERIGELLVARKHSFRSTIN